jgi:ankyrin repeat protein
MSLKRIFLGSAAMLAVGIFAGPRLIAADRTVADSAMIGDTAAIRALLAQHADINAPQADGATALHWAVYRNDVALAKLLIEAGMRSSRSVRQRSCWQLETGIPRPSRCCSITAPM